MLSDRHRNSSSPLLCFHSCGGSSPSPDSDKGPEIFISELRGARHAHIKTWTCLTTCVASFIRCRLFSSLLQVTGSSLDQSLGSCCVSSAWDSCPPTTFHLSESDAFRPRPNRLYSRGAYVILDHVRINIVMVTYHESHNESTDVDVCLKAPCGIKCLMVGPPGCDLVSVLF